MPKLCTYLEACSEQSRWTLVYFAAILDCDYCILEALFVTTLACCKPRNTDGFAYALKRKAFKQLRRQFGRYQRDLPNPEWNYPYTQELPEYVWNLPNNARIRLSAIAKISAEEKVLVGVGLYNRPFPELPITPLFFWVKNDELHYNDEGNRTCRVKPREVDRQLTEYIQKIIKLATHENNAVVPAAVIF